MEAGRKGVCVRVCAREQESESVWERKRERERERASLFALNVAMNFEWNFLTVESNDALDKTLFSLEKIFHHFLSLIK